MTVLGFLVNTWLYYKYVLCICFMDMYKTYMHGTYREIVYRIRGES